LLASVVYKYAITLLPLNSLNTLRRPLVNLYLVGYRCAGKTSVGRLLSDALGWVFVDMDHQLAAGAGMPIQDIVASRGWHHFREIEGRLLKRLSRTARQVIATGGGVVTVASNIRAMRASGKVVWLQVSSAVVAERMVADDNSASQRPPLHGENAFVEIEKVLGERLPLYEQAMHFRVDTDGLSPREVTDSILAWFGP
jgi:shikimate kinase